MLNWKTMSNLPNKSRYLDASMDPIRSAKRPRYIGKVPGVPDLTDKFFDSGAVTHWENEGNMGVTLTVHMRATDKDFINEGQYVWMNNLDPRRPKLMSLVQINKILFDLQTGGVVEREYKKFEQYFAHNEDLVKAFVFDNFVPYGTLAVRDNFDETKYSNNTTKAHTVVAHGQGFVLDYWSYAKNKIRPYSALYFILKKVPCYSGMYQTKINTNAYDLPRENGNPQMLWQIVPFFKPVGNIEFKDYSNLETGEIGFYWFVGRVHENQKIVSSSTERRNELTTSRQTPSLYASVEPMLQIYVLKDRKNPMILL